jgi:hypothetical protein
MTENISKKKMISQQPAEGLNDTVNRQQQIDAVADFNRLVGRCLAHKWLSEQESSPNRRPVG